MIKKALIFFIFLISTLQANLLDSVVYVENLDSKSQKSLKEEFFKEDTKLYTLTVAALTSSKHNSIEFFKTYKMKNALAYKFGQKKQYTRIISGVYDNYKEAKDAISKLDKRLLLNKPYPISIKRHQQQFKKFNLTSSNIKNYKAINKVKSKKQTFKSTSGDLIASNSEESLKLKEELTKKGSRLYAVAIASIPRSSLEKFLKNNNISDKAIAHTYGKDKKNVRVIYGLYKNYKEARKDIKNLNSTIKANKPYAMKMKHFQNYFRKHNPNYSQEEIVELQVNNKKQEEIASKPKLDESIKIVKAKKAPTTKKFNEPKKEEKKAKPKPKKPTKQNKQVEKKKPKKQVNKSAKPKSREELNKTRFLKEAELEDVYYIESDGEFNLLSEVFLNENSSFFTIDLGEIKLDESSIEKFFIQNNLDNDAVAYKYGKNKEYARAIYGAYESQSAATNAIKNLKVNSGNVRVSNIKNHQKLYKMYHENILKAGPKNKTKNSTNKTNKKTIKKSENDIVYVEQTTEENSLKDEFFKAKSSYYTITLVTFHKYGSTPKRFFKENEILNHSLAFSLGSKNDYYRIIYGLFKSRDEAMATIENLSDKLLENKPYISRVQTTKKRFESYNGRKIRNYKAVKIEIE